MCSAALCSRFGLLLMGWIVDPGKSWPRADAVKEGGKGGVIRDRVPPGL